LVNQPFSIKKKKKTVKNFFLFVFLPQKKIA
jgi:hypothetical protein